MLGPLTYLDLALISIAAISGLLAMYRGLSRELLSILSWAVAGGAAALVVLTQKPLAEDMTKQIGVIPNVAITQGIMAIVVFLITVIIVQLITARIADAISDSPVGMIDRILGLGFGVVRGFVIVLIPFMFYEAYFSDPKVQYPWVRNAASHGMLSSSGKAVQGTLLGIAERLQSKQRGEQQSLHKSREIHRMTLATPAGIHISVMPHGAGRTQS